MPPPANPRSKQPRAKRAADPNKPCCGCKGNCASAKCPCVRAYRKCTVHYRRKQLCGNPPCTSPPQTDESTLLIRPEPVLRDQRAPIFARPPSAPHTTNTDSRHPARGRGGGGPARQPARAPPVAIVPSAQTTALVLPTAPKTAQAINTTAPGGVGVMPQCPTAQAGPAHANAPSNPALQQGTLQVQHRPAPRESNAQRVGNLPCSPPSGCAVVQRHVTPRPCTRIVVPNPSNHRLPEAEQYNHYNPTGESEDDAPTGMDDSPTLDTTLLHPAGARGGPPRDGIRKPTHRVIRAPPTVCVASILIQLLVVLKHDHYGRASKN